MKKILFMTLLLFGCVGVFAQERTIEQSEFDTVYRNSFRWGRTPYRMTITSQSRTEGRSQTDYSSKTTMEFAFPVGSRITMESHFGGKDHKNETIRIGNKTYTRKNDEAWTEKLAESTPPPKPALAGSENDDQIEYKYFGSEQLNDQTATVYGKIVNRKTIHPSNNKEIVSVVTTKFWFGNGGIILKSDMEQKSRIGETLYITRLTQIWESDPNIKIEAPELSQIK